MKNERHLRDLNSRGTNPIGLAGQRLNHSAKVSFAQTYLSHLPMYHDTPLILKQPNSYSVLWKQMFKALRLIKCRFESEDEDHMWQIVML